MIFCVIVILFSSTYLVFHCFSLLLLFVFLFFVSPQRYPHTVIDLSMYYPFQPKPKMDDCEATLLPIEKYVATLCVVCSTGEIVVHLHHVRHLRTKRGEELTSTMDQDLLGIDLGEVGTAPLTETELLDEASPMLIMMSFNVNGALNSQWSGATSLDVNPTMTVDAPLLSLEASRRSPVIIGGASNGQILLWHARDLVLLSCYSTGGFAAHSLSLCPSEEFLAVGCDAGVMVTIAMPNCRDGADPSVDNGSTGGISGRVESVRKKVGGAARVVGKNVGAVAGSALSAGKRLFGGLWGRKKT